MSREGWNMWDLYAGLQDEAAGRQPRAARWYAVHAWRQMSDAERAAKADVLAFYVAREAEDAARSASA